MTHSPVTVWTPHINCLFINFKLQEGPDIFITFFLLSRRHMWLMSLLSGNLWMRQKWLMMNRLLSIYKDLVIIFEVAAFWKWSVIQIWTTFSIGKDVCILNKRVCTYERSHWPFSLFPVEDQLLSEDQAQSPVVSIKLRKGEKLAVKVTAQSS